MEAFESHIRRIIKSKRLRDFKLQKLIEKSLVKKTFEVSKLTACEAHKHLPGLTEINGKIKILQLEYDRNNRISLVWFLHEKICYVINGSRFIQIEEIGNIVSKVKNDYYGRSNADH